MIQPGEIVHANLTFVGAKRKTVTCKEVIFSRPYEGEFQTKYKMSNREDESFLKKYGIVEDMELTKVEVIKSLGFKVPPNTQGVATLKASEKDERQKNGSFI